MGWGFFATYFLLTIVWGGFTREPTIVQMIGFGLTGGSFAIGLALALFRRLPLHPITNLKLRHDRTAVMCGAIAPYCSGIDLGE